MAALALWLIGFCGLASAQGAVPARAPAVAASEQGPTWASLTPEQRSSLSPLQGEWGRIDPTRKQKWLELASRLPSMSPAERERVQVRMAEWVRMTPAERGRARLQFQETRRWTPTDRQERWQAYQDLPSEQRQALAAKASPPAPKPAAKPAAAASSAMPETKHNTANLAPPPSRAKAIAPTVVQARPGATTSLVTKPAAPPPHYQTGMPKIAATKGFVDPATLLPKRGPQGAAVTAAPAPVRPASASR